MPSISPTISQKPEAIVVYIRCMRCRREIEAMSTDIIPAVKISTNLYYCFTCAKETGYSKEK